MKKGAKITLIVLAAVLVLIVAAFLILSCLYEMQWTGGLSFYLRNENAGSLTICRFPYVGNCRTLSNVENVQQVGDHVFFAEVNSSTAVVFGSGSTWYYASFKSATASPDEYHHDSPLWDTTTEEAIVLDGVTGIADNFFRGCDSLKSIYFPASLRRLSTLSLPHCSTLTLHFQGDCPEIFYWCSEYADTEEPNPLLYITRFLDEEKEFLVYYQPGTSGWEEGQWAEYATLTEQEYQIDWE